MPFCLVKEEHPSSAVEFSATGSFTSEFSLELVVCRSRQLEIYASPVIDGMRAQMDLIAEFPLWGLVTDMLAVRFPGRKRHSIVVAFEDAKMSVLDFDIDSLELKPSFLHNAETIIPACEVPPSYQSLKPVLRLDPQLRCFILLVYGRYLHVFPLAEPTTETDFILDDESFSENDDEDPNHLFRSTSSKPSVVALPGLQHQPTPKKDATPSRATMEDNICPEKIEPGESKPESRPMWSFVDANGDLKYFSVDLQQELRIRHVIMLEFLHGYYDPHLVVLHEKGITWAGRVEMEKNTCALTAVSLNLNGSNHSVIWDVPDLPHDTCSLTALPKPVGGVIVVTSSAVIHFSQLGARGVLTTDYVQPNDYPQHKLERSDEDILLDCVTLIVVDDTRLLLSLRRTGDIYAVDLQMDGNRVSHLDLYHAGRSVIISCVVSLGDGVYFFGSRLGDSEIVRVSSEAWIKSGAPGVDEVETLFSSNTTREVDERPPKKPRFEDGDDGMGLFGDAIGLHNEGVVSNGYGRRIYSFDTLLRLPCIAPVNAITVGPLDNSTRSLRQYRELDMVACCGYGTMGSLRVLQRSVRPVILTSVPLPDVQRLWTLRYHIKSKKQRMKEHKSEERDNHHTHCIVSLPDRTLILETGAALQEVTDIQIYTDGPTIVAATICGSSRLVQICRSGVRVLAGDAVCSEYQSEVDIKDASVEDPFIFLQMRDDRPVILQYVEKGRVLTPLSLSESLGAAKKSVASRRTKGLNQLAISTMCLFRSLRGLWNSTPDPVKSSLGSPTEHVVLAAISWLTGGLTIHCLPSGACVFRSTWLHRLPRLLCDVQSPSTSAAKEDAETLRHKKSFFHQQSSLVEANVCRIAISHHPYTPCRSSHPDAPEGTALLRSGLPFLVVVLDDGHYAVYKPFVRTGGEVVDLRFLKASCGLYEPISSPQNSSSDDVEQVVPTVTPFKQIGQYSGFYLSGTVPVFLFCGNGYVRSIPHELPLEAYKTSPRTNASSDPAVEGGVIGFSPFHHASCNRGFMCCVSGMWLETGTFDSDMDYSTPWPQKRVGLGGTPLHVCYHPESHTYAAIVAEPGTMSTEQSVEYLKKAADITNQIIATAAQEPDILKSTAGDDPPPQPPHHDRHELRLFSAETLQVEDKFELDLNEHATDLKTVNVRTSKTSHATSQYIAVSTTYCETEELTPHGRLLIFEVYKQTDFVEIGRVVKMTLKFEKPHQGTVSALHQLDGCILLSHGSKAIMYRIHEDELHGLAFFDAQVMITSFSVVKDLVIYGDILSGLHFVHWQNGKKKMAKLSQDDNQMETFAQEFLLKDDMFMFVVSDDAGNLTLMEYAPHVLESFDGKRLVTRGVTQIGSPVLCMLRIPLLQDDRPAGTAEKSRCHGVYFGTRDGAIGIIMPVDETTYRRVSSLSNKMHSAIPAPAGITLKANRTYRAAKNTPGPRPPPSSTSRALADGDILPLYVAQSTIRQHEFAVQVGTSSERLLVNMRCLQRTLGHF